MDRPDFFTKGTKITYSPLFQEINDKHGWVLFTVPYTLEEGVVHVGQETLLHVKIKTHNGIVRTKPLDVKYFKVFDPVTAEQSSIKFEPKKVDAPKVDTTMQEQAPLPQNPVTESEELSQLLQKVSNLANILRNKLRVIETLEGAVADLQSRIVNLEQSTGLQNDINEKMTKVISLVQKVQSNSTSLPTTRSISRKKRAST